MNKSNLSCNHIDKRTKIYFDRKPDPELVDLTCQLFKSSNSGSAETQFNEKFNLIHRLSFSEVYSFTHNEEVYYAKKFIVRSLEKNVSHYCKGPKGVRNMSMAQKLTSYGFQVPESVFVISHQKSQFYNENTYLTKKYDGITLAEFFLKNIVLSKDKVRTALLNLTNSLGIFYRNRFCHGDLNFRNFLVKEDGEIAFIDLNTIQQSPVLTWNQVLNDLASLNSYIFLFLYQNNLSHLYTAERALFYLKNILKTYPRQVELLEAFSQLTHKTIQHLTAYGRTFVITPDSFLGQIRLKNS